MTKTIMIVDDSSSVRVVVGNTLRDSGYKVLEACDGKDALSKLTGQKIHLILSDVNMPNMDGFTLVEEIKKLPDYKYTPICMLTTEAGRSEKDKGKATGAKAWMTKPFQPAKLLEVIERLIP